VHLSGHFPQGGIQVLARLANVCKLVIPDVNKKLCLTGGRLAMPK
jgi:hypothetical protein